MKVLTFFFSFLVSAGAFAQAIYPVDSATNQPLVYRHSSGSYNGCGVRTLFATSVPKSTHMGDISVNVFKNSQGQIIGMAKAIYLYVPDVNNINNFKRVPISSFMMANSGGKAIKLLGIKPSEDKEALISTTPEEDALSFIVDVTTGKTVQVGIQLKGDKTLRIFTVKPDLLTKDESNQLVSCLEQITKTK